MSSEPLDLEIPAGVVKSQSENAVGARYTDMDKTRFHDGKPQKIGGNSRLFDDMFESYARGAALFRDQHGNQNICFGTSDRLYMIETGQVLYNVTPLKSSGTLTDPFSTTDGSDIVTVFHFAHGLVQIGDVVNYTTSHDIGGVTIAGEYQVYNVVDNDTYQIQASALATSTTSGVGGSVDYEYEIHKGAVDGALANGWGVGAWGEETWGTPRESDSVQLDPRTWSIQEYGRSILACYTGSVLYHFVWTSGARALPVANSPRMNALVVTPERYPLALGAVPIGETEINPMCVRWPDVDDITDWLPSAEDRANQRILQSGAQLIGGAALSSFTTLVWSDNSLYAFQFTGSSFIYDSPLIGEKCGLAGPHCYYIVDDVAYWMGPNGFHMYDGSVRSIPRATQIREYVMKAFNTVQLKKAFTVYFSEFREVWFVYPSDDSLEPDRYVGVNIDTYDWIIGTISRSAACDYRSDEASPVMFGTDGRIYKHEDGSLNDDGQAMEAFVETGLIKIANGKASLHIQGFIPDLDRQSGDLELYVFTREHPKGPLHDEQTETIEEDDMVVDLRAEGRHLGYRLTSNEVDGDFRMGVNQLEIDVAGRARGR